MQAFQRATWRLYSTPPYRRRILTGLTLAAVSWVFLQKGCVLNPDIAPAQTVADTGAVAAQSVMTVAADDAPVSVQSLPNRQERRMPRMDQGAPNKPLRQASHLLRQAAAMLDKNDRGAIRLILQAIAILKHEIMRGADGLDYDRISSSPFPSERQESWETARAALSLFRDGISRHESDTLLYRQSLTDNPLSRNTGRWPGQEDGSRTPRTP